MEAPSGEAGNGNHVSSSTDPAAVSESDKPPEISPPLVTSTVFKKQSPNSRLTLYLSTRDFIQESGKVTPIDGVVVVDPVYLKERKVFAMVVLTFRYGREDEEVMGLKFYTEAIVDFKQVYPEEIPEKEKELTSLQQNLIRKLGKEAYPLTLHLSPHAPASVRLQPARPYTGSPLGVSYDLKVFVAEKSEEKPHKRSTVRMSLRCLQYVSPETYLPVSPPTASISKSFVFSPGRLEMEAVLDKPMYHQGDPVHVHVTVDNNSNKTIQKIKVLVLQHVNVCMFTNGRFKNIVGSAETEDGHPISPGGSLSRDFCIRLLSFLKYPVALAVEGSFVEETGRLAPSTTTAAADSAKDKNAYGVVVSYEVKVKATLGYMDRPITFRLPFKLIHNAAEDDEENAAFKFSNTAALPCTSNAQDTDDCVSDEIARLVMLNA